VHLPAAGSLPNHVPRDGLRLKHRALEVHVEHEIEHLFGIVLGLRLAIQPDAVDQDVDPPEVRRDLVHHALRFGHRERVEGRCVGFAAL